MVTITLVNYKISRIIYYQCDKFYVNQG